MASDRDDRRAAATALASLQRLADLGPALSCPPTARYLPTRCHAASRAPPRQTARRRPDRAAWYGARRVFAYALMIYDGIPAEDLDQYLRARAWFTDAAQLLRLSRDDQPANSSAP